MTSSMISFIGKLTAVLAVSFAIHSSLQHFLEIGAFEKQIIITYLFVYLITIASYILMVRMSKSNTQKLGFVFLYASLVKFVLFFSFIYPSFEVRGTLKSAEFASFFVPYSIALVVEIIELVRLLNRSS